MCITADMKSRMRVGEKGQVVIPKELRELTGIKEGTEVTVGLKDGAVTITRASPPTESYRILHKHLLEEASPRSEHQEAVGGGKG